MAVRRIVPAALIAAAIGCAQPAPPPPAKPDGAAVKAMLAPYWARFAAADTACNATTLGSMVTADAKFDGAGMAFTSRAAWVAATEAQCKKTRPTSLTVIASEDWADGDHLYERGTFTEGSMTANKGKMEYGKYFVQFVKDSTGNLWMSRGAFMTDSTPAMKPVPKAAPAKATPSKAPAKSPAKKAPTKKS